MLLSILSIYAVVFVTTLCTANALGQPTSRSHQCNAIYNDWRLAEVVVYNCFFYFELSNMPFSETALMSAPRFISSNTIATFPTSAAQSSADLLSSSLRVLTSDDTESWNGSASSSKHRINLSTFPVAAHSIAILMLRPELSVLLLSILGVFSGCSVKLTVDPLLS